jgi:hypothetical protein
LRILKIVMMEVSLAWEKIMIVDKEWIKGSKTKSF